MTALEITCVQFDSKSELLHALECHVSAYCLGTNTESPKEFFMFSIAKAETAVAHIGVLSMGNGVMPQGYAIEDHSILMGFNDRIAAVSLNANRLVSEQELSSVFWAFLGPFGDLVAVLCESAVLLVTATGKVAGRADTDLVTDYHASSERVKLWFMDDTCKVVEFANLLRGA